MYKEKHHSEIASGINNLVYQKCFARCYVCMYVPIYIHNKGKVVIIIIKTLTLRRSDVYLLIILALTAQYQYIEK